MIIGFARVLNIPLSKLRQPRVISEVLGGIIRPSWYASATQQAELSVAVGPTAFGRIPGFTEHIFPEPSLPFLSLVSELGLVLFLFLVGLEYVILHSRNARKVELMRNHAGSTLRFFARTCGSRSAWREWGRSSPLRWGQLSAWVSSTSS